MDDGWHRFRMWLSGLYTEVCGTEHARPPNLYQPLSPPLRFTNTFVANKYAGVVHCSQAGNCRSWK